MQLTTYGANQTELQTATHLVFFSYRTPVAAFDLRDGRAYKTAKKWSVTTSRHVNKYLANKNAHDVVEMPQAFFDNLTANS